MNRGEIRSRIIEALREEETPVEVSTDELNEYIDDGYEEVAELTGAVVTDTVVSCPAKEHFIPLPANCLYPLAIIDTSSSRPIDLKHWTFIDRRDRVWIRSFRQRPYYAAAWSLTHLLVYPAYENAGSLTLTHAVIPGPLANDASVPDIPEQYHRGLQHYGHHRVLLKDADERRFGRSLRQRRYYLESLSDLSDWSGKRHEGIRQAIYGTKLRDGENFWETGVG